MLDAILQNLNKDTEILVLPAGFVNSFNKKPQTIFKDLEKTIVALITKFHLRIIICFGVDGRYKTDQLSLAFNNKGIVALAQEKRLCLPILYCCPYDETYEQVQ